MSGPPNGESTYRCSLAGMAVTSNRASRQQVDGGYVDGEVNVWYRTEPPGPIDDGQGPWRALDAEGEATAYYRDDGKEVVIVEPASGSLRYDRELRRVVPIASALQGKVVFHGSAVRLGDGVILFTGPSGAGKSTLAEALQLVDVERISDDLLPVRDRGGEIVVPRLDATGGTSTIAVSGVCFIERSPADLDVRSLGRTEALDRLCFNSYADLPARKNWRLQFEIIASLVNQAFAATLAVPHGLEGLSAVAEELKSNVLPSLTAAAV